MSEDVWVDELLVMLFMEEKELFEFIDEVELICCMNVGWGGIMVGLYCDFYCLVGVFVWMFLWELLDGFGKRIGILKGDRRRVGVSERDGVWFG